MSRASIVALLLVACTGRGASREGAVAVTAHLALRPAADGEAWVRDVVDALAQEQANQHELTAEGERAQRTLPHIEIADNPIHSDRFPPVYATTIRAAERATLAQALARASRDAAGDVVPVYEKTGEGWELHFVHTLQGFELAPGAMANIGAPAQDGDLPGVQVFLADEDAARFEQLTRDHLGRRIAVVTGDEALMIPVVNDVIPGGTLWITPGVEQSPDALLARLVR